MGNQFKVYGAFRSLIFNPQSHEGYWSLISIDALVIKVFQKAQQMQEMELES
jgi:hypothetical protein